MRLRDRCVYQSKFMPLRQDDHNYSHLTIVCQYPIREREWLPDGCKKRKGRGIFLEHLWVQCQYRNACTLLSVVAGSFLLEKMEGVACKVFLGHLTYWRSPCTAWSSTPRQRRSFTTPELTRTVKPCRVE